MRAKANINKGSRYEDKELLTFKDFEDIPHIINIGSELEGLLPHPYAMGKYDKDVGDEIIRYVNELYKLGHFTRGSIIVTRINNKIINIDTDITYLTIIKKYLLMETFATGKYAKYRRICTSRLKYYGVSIRDDYKIDIAKHVQKDQEGDTLDLGYMCVQDCGEWEDQYEFDSEMLAQLDENF